MAGAPRPPPPGRDWFSTLFGFSETSYGEAKRWLRAEQAAAPGPGGLRPVLIHSLANQQSFSAGVFETPSLMELREQVASVRLPGRLRVKNQNGDVGAFLAAPENRYATFQVASQFNCLEMVGPSITPDEGIAGYERDRTQGPCCSVACGAATAYRNYFAKVGEQEGQTAQLQLDCLADFGRVLDNTPPGRYWEVINGYSMVGSNAQLKMLSDTITKMDSDQLDQARQALRVGVHNDVQVTASSWGSRLLRDREQVVTQVFGSALAVAYNRSTSRDLWAPFAQLVLEASYEATLCAAVLAAARHGQTAGSNRVFLTALGGGVFGNSMGWIAHAMERAFKRFEGYDLDVRIITYSGRPDERFLKLEQKFRG